MTIKKEPSGRRSVQIEVEVPGTPEEVWRAIATGPGISSWLVPTAFTTRDGKPDSITMNFGPGMEMTSAITTWKPLQMWATESVSPIPNAPPFATEWSIETRAGGLCIVRMVQSLFATTDDWDNQLEAGSAAMVAFLRTLKLYLTHFRNLPSTSMKLMAPVAAPEAQAWSMLMASLGLQSARPGQRWTSPPGVPAFSGVVELYSENPYDALLRIDTPGPGIAAVGAFNCGGPSIVGLNLYLYGEQGPAVAAREKPLWEAWFRERFPVGEEAGQGG